MACRRLALSLFIFVILDISSPQEWNTNDYFKREHSLVKPYQGLSTNIPYWDFLGSTMITSNYVRLTGDVQSVRGALWNQVPIHLRNWEVQIHFKVHGRGKDLFGDGFAFWYVREPMQFGDVFGSKDYFTGLAIIADTYSNHNGPHNHGHPYVSGMINNGTLHYDHDRDGTHTQLSGCVSKFRNLDHDTYVSIRYHHNKLTVMTDIENKRAFKECFSVDDVILPTGYFFGVSAATGELSDAHDIISIKTYDLTTPDDKDITEDRSNVMPSASYFEPPRDHVEDPSPSTMGTWKTVLLLILGVVAICGCVFIGGLLYTKHQEGKRKRFY